MSGRNGIAERRGGRETPSAPVSDAGEVLRLALALAKAENERDKWKARAKSANAEKRRLAAKLKRLKKRGVEARHYDRGNFTNERAAQILREEGYVTPQGKTPTTKWVSRVRNGEIDELIFDFPNTTRCTEQEFRLWARREARSQRSLAPLVEWRR